jgi:DNA-binding response OmpR family regulator
MILEADTELVDVLKAILDQVCETFVARDPTEAEIQVQTVEPDLLILSGQDCRG